MSKVIRVKQKPIIEYSVIDEVANRVEEKIKALNIDTLEPTEGNLSLIKAARAELNNEFRVLEEQRKIVKDIVLRDYNIFENKYKKLIASKFKEADTTLKGLVQTVTDEILNKKIEGIKSYFNSVNPYDFVTFEDLDLKIIKSKSDKKIKDEVDEYLATIKQSLETIETLPNKERVLAKFQVSKNLSDAIAQTNMEIQREEQIKAQNEARAKAQQEAEIQRQEELHRQEQMQSVESKQVHEEPVQEEKQVFKASFAVYGTRAQLRALEEFMNEQNIKYEGK